MSRYLYTKIGGWAGKPAHVHPSRSGSGTAYASIGYIPYGASQPDPAKPASRGIWIPSDCRPYKAPAVLSGASHPPAPDWTIFR